ncbi:hypothetical protein HMPREF9442_00813 [Paraprevotella xylaniphila YIT 11841]|uniref:Uncharacterized protein n=1 Tax=Paraprevotella xylaniphila YIT 11841 TaxID=762982 RepID=F3QRK9_9BACT|nr:hypothetical protein HMPREF9442_00813 [Paraprevotella xylaniphila YIT 11841]
MSLLVSGKDKQKCVFSLVCFLKRMKMIPYVLPMCPFSVKLEE